MEAKPAYQNFEEAFDQLLEKAKNEPVSMHTFLNTLSGKGKILLLMFISLGFLQIPGIGIPLGLFIAYLGARIAMGRRFIWCPKFLLHKKIPSSPLVKVLKRTLSTLNFIKRWSKPRYEWAANMSPLITGIVIAVVGICIASSPPIPLTGLLASLAIFLLAIGLLNLDGIYLLLGYIASALYLVQVIILIHYFSISKIVAWVKGLFV